MHLNVKRAEWRCKSEVEVLEKGWEFAGRLKSITQFRRGVRDGSARWPTLSIVILKHWAYVGMAEGL